MQDLASLEKDFHSQGSNKWQAMAAFRQMALHAAKQVGAQFVLVDMGPSTDDVNRTLATSADVIQPCACPDSYSWSGAMRLFTDVMPAWMGWWTQHKFAERQSGTDHKYNRTFPRIMPFMAMQVSEMMKFLMCVFEANMDVHSLQPHADVKSIWTNLPFAP